MSKLNPQKASAYVGPGVLRKGGKITPVPNGPLIKKKGPFKGSTLKAGGVIKKAQSGASLEERKEARRVSDSIKKEKLKKVYSKSYEETKKPGQSYDDWYNAYNEQTKINSFKAKEPRGDKTFFASDNGPKSPCKGGACFKTNKNGSTIKKAQAGKRVPVNSVSTLTAPKGTTVDTKPKGRDLTSSEMTRLTSVPKTKAERYRAIYTPGYERRKDKSQTFEQWDQSEKERTQKNSAKNRRWDWLKSDGGGSSGGSGGAKSPCKGGFCPGLNSSSRNGSTIKKAKAGTKVKKAMMGMGSMFKDNPIYKKTTAMRGKLGSAALGMPGMKPIVKNGNRIKKAQNGEYVTQEGKNYTATKKVTTKNGPRYYQAKSPNLSFAREVASFKQRANPSDSIPKVKLSPRALEMMNKKNGGMLKRADGSYSKRGLWDNIRANKGSGNKPTKQMLVQEKKIKAKTKK
jgi:hypothetical protein